MTSFRWFPLTRADGVRNMATDDVLLDLATTEKVVYLRFYGWMGPTLSLGYFQAAAERLSRPSIAQLPFVRRPSGGKALIHHRELTYALALPPGFAPDWMPRMHSRIILPALDDLGLAGQVRAVEPTISPPPTTLCFALKTGGDLVCAGHKVVGSAQRKHRQALLQHGAILLRKANTPPSCRGSRNSPG